MLEITVPPSDKWDEEKSVFIIFPGEVLLLEHSLASISKWESFTEKPFLAKADKTHEDIVEYIRFMCISPVNHPEVFDNLSDANFDAISKYINLKMTATWFKEDAPSRPTGEIVTSEIVYHWMIALNVPMECQYWHFARLLTLVRVLNIKNAPPKKQDRQSMAQQRRALNEQRMAAQQNNS